LKTYKDISGKKKSESKKWGIILLLALGLYSGMVQGQLLRINIEVKDNVRMEQIMPFTFDITASNKTASPFDIKTERGAQNLSAWGVYSLVGRENILVMVRLEAPDMLRDEQNNTMPLELTMAWQNDGTQDETTAKPAKNNNAVFPLNNSGLLIENMKKAPALLHAYIFLRGTVKISKTTTSTYEGKLHLIVEYE
jgi:hypothetical protein